MSDIFRVALVGHGGWNPKDGFVRGPERCQVVFYQSLGKAVPALFVNMIIQSEIDVEKSFCIIDSINEAATAITNMSLFPFEGEEADAYDEYESYSRCAENGFYLLYDRSHAVTLEALMQRFFSTNLGKLEGKIIQFHWCACRAVQLKSSAAGQRIGVNATVWV